MTDLGQQGGGFVVRNELVVALGELLIVTETDLNSGSMRSVEYALKMGKRYLFYLKDWMKVLKPMPC